MTDYKGQIVLVEDDSTYQSLAERYASGFVLSVDIFSSFEEADIVIRERHSEGIPYKAIIADNHIEGYRNITGAQYLAKLAHEEENGTALVEYIFAMSSTAERGYVRNSLRRYMQEEGLNGEQVDSWIGRIDIYSKHVETSLPLFVIACNLYKEEDHQLKREDWIVALGYKVDDNGYVTDETNFSSYIVDNIVMHMQRLSLEDKIAFMTSMTEKARESRSIEAQDSSPGKER